MCNYTWVALQQCRASFQSFVSHLGWTLKIDIRGFTRFTSKNQLNHLISLSNITLSQKFICNFKNPKKKQKHIKPKCTRKFFFVLYFLCYTCQFYRRFHSHQTFVHFFWYKCLNSQVSPCSACKSYHTHLLPRIYYVKRLA